LPNKGFTFIEIVVALAVVSIGVLILAKMQILSIKGTGYNKETTTAIALAQKTVEDCRAVAFGTKPEGCDKEEGGMTVTCEMNMSGDAPYRLNDITVRVSWGAPRNKISVSTAVAER
jgi:prepilin-type N-terminal cleavage/methylation domain-containing protein